MLLDRDWCLNSPQDRDKSESKEGPLNMLMQQLLMLCRPEIGQKSIQATFATCISLT